MAESIESLKNLRTIERLLILIAGGLALAATAAMLVQGPRDGALILAAVVLALAAWSGKRLITESTWTAGIIFTVVSLCTALLLLGKLAPGSTPESSPHGSGYWMLVMAAWLIAWAAVEQFASIRSLSGLVQFGLRLLIPVLFGGWLLLGWEFFTRGLDIPQVLLPAPSVIGERFGNSMPILWADFKQTFLKAVLIGYAIGCGAGFIVAILIDRSPFLQRGLLPIGNLVSALPIVGVAPIMVMWFGFDWPSKAAVVIVMTFFPMLVNTVSGLAASNAMQRDLLKTYAASYWQRLFKLRLPEALPFIFNALKINSTLALIGAIVAEFFGTPIVGMGFRISTEVGRMNVDMVWAEIAVAAVAGSLFYGVLSVIERIFTFWHPSMRSSGHA